MLTRDNILDIINKYQEKIDDLERELKTITNDNVRDAVKDKLMDLVDNKFRHELQASAWGLMPRPSLPIETEHYVIFEAGVTPPKNKLHGH